MKFLNALINNPSLSRVLTVFTDSSATQDAVASAGERFLVSQYGYSGKTIPTLNHLRYIAYNKAAFRFRANMVGVPPSAAAARQHSLRVYHQVQQWLGVRKAPAEWGWKSTKSGLEPVVTLLPPAPPTLLKLVTCRCKKDCQRNCGCKKAGLICALTVKEAATTLQWWLKTRTMK